MKVAHKYVIELEKSLLSTNGNLLFKVKGFNTLVFDENGLSKLKRLENVAKDIRQEAYNLGFEQAAKQLKEECNRARREGFEEGKKNTDHYGCGGCEYEYMDKNCEPCCFCRMGCDNRYKPKKIKPIVEIRKNDICKIEDTDNEVIVTRVSFTENDWGIDAMEKSGRTYYVYSSGILEYVRHVDSLDGWLNE